MGVRRWNGITEIQSSKGIHATYLTCRRDTGLPMIEYTLYWCRGTRGFLLYVFDSLYLQGTALLMDSRVFSMQPILSGSIVPFRDAATDGRISYSVYWILWLCNYCGGYLEIQRSSNIGTFYYSRYCMLYKLSFELKSNNVIFALDCPLGKYGNYALHCAHRIFHTYIFKIL